jgi:hypothetical protein
VPPGVGEQVGQYLVQPVLIAKGEHGIVRELEDPPVTGPGDLGVAGCLDGQPGQVNRF